MISDESEDDGEDVEMRMCEVCGADIAKRGVVVGKEIALLLFRCNRSPPRTFETIMVDYHFLEDVLQTKSAAKRALSSAGGSHQNKRQGNKWGADTVGPTSLDQVFQSSAGGHSASAAKLVKGARGHGVELSLMPTGMSRRKKNCTRYHKNIDKIYWKVHVIFVLHDLYAPGALLQADLEGPSNDGALLGLTSSRQQQGVVAGQGGNLADAAVDEEVTMGDLLDQFLCTTADQLAYRHLLRTIRGSRGSLQCLIQKIPSPASRPLFYEVPLDFTLRSALSGKRVIENPTFIVGTKPLLSPLQLFVQEVGDDMIQQIGEEQSVSSSMGLKRLAVAAVDQNTEGSEHTSNAVTPSGEAGMWMEELCVHSPDKRRRTAGPDADPGVGMEEECDMIDGTEEIHVTSDEEEEEEAAISEEFLRELKMLESQDISTIQAIISRMEAEEEAN